MPLLTAPSPHRSFVFAALGCLDRDTVVDALRLVTPTTLALASVAVIALLAACVVVVVADAAGDGEGSTPRPRQGFASRRFAAMSTAVLFLAVFSAKLVLLRQNPVTAPYWDQWDGEARVLYLPFSDCTLSWVQMFSLHNEHRFFFSRLLALDLLLANGQWDPRLQQVVNAALHSIIAVLVVAILWSAQQRRRLDLLVLIAALTFALPFAWENTLLGFQSGFYFLLLFSILGLWLTTSRVRTLPWALGWLCALCGLFTGASGLLLAVAIAGVAALRVMNDHREWTDARVTFAAGGAILAVGLLMSSSPLPYHEVLRAKTMSDFAGALGRNLAWPWVTHPQLTLVMWLPMGVLLFMVARRRAQMTLLERFTIGLGFWVALHAAVFAYARGAGAPVPAARYQDFLSLGFVANAMAAIAWFDRMGSGPTGRRVAATVLVTWFLVPVVGLHGLVVDTQTTLSLWRQYWSAQASTVRRYVITGDLAEFVAKRPIEQLPYLTPRSWPRCCASHRFAVFCPQPSASLCGWSHGR